MALLEKQDTHHSNDEFDPAAKTAKNLLERENSPSNSAGRSSFDKNSYDEPGAMNDPSALDDREKKQGQQGLYSNASSPETSDEPAQQSRASKFRNAIIKGMTRKKLGATAGISGIAIGLFGLMLSILPLKLDAFVSTITDQLSSVAQYPIEQRVEYLVTRWITMRAMQEAYPGDENIVFCRGGGLLCHLGSTKYSQWFEEQLDAKFEAEGRKVRVVLNSQGRDSLGGKATSFTVHLESNDVNSAIKGVEKELTHRDVRRHIRTMTKKVHGRNIFMRYLSKRVLYRKYGVKKFTIAEKKVKKYAEFKAEIKTNMHKRIAEKMSPRLAAYLGCLSGRDRADCKKTLDELNNDLDKRISEAEEKNGPDSDEVKKKKGQKDTLKQIEESVKGGEGAIGKILGKQIVRKLATGAAIIGAIDMVAGIVGAIDSKTMELIGSDQISQLYTAFTYDEEISPVLVRDQMRAGDLDSNERIQLATSMFDGAESSPLYQSTFGSRASASSLLYPTAYAASGGIRTKCDVGGEQKVVTLDPGEVVCPEKKIVQDYTAFTKYPAWQVLAGIAEVWNSTLGAFIDFVGDVVGKVFGFFFEYIKEMPGIKQIAEFSEGMIEKVINWAMSLIFRMPEIGIDSPGNNNYEALHGGITTAVQGSTEAGREKDDGANATSGIGGQRLTPEQLGAIYDEVEARRDEDFRDQPLMAKLFDTSQSRSVASQLLAIMPMSSMSTLRLLTHTPVALTSALMPTPSYAANNSRTAALNAFGVIWHGYPNKEVLKADPTQYNDELCNMQRKKRAESYDLHGGLVGSYAEADPCALEITVAATFARAAGDEENPYYPKEIDESGTNPQTPGGASSPGEAIGPPELDEAQKFGNGMAWGGYPNGQIPESALRELTTVPGHFLHPKASEAFDAMNEAYAADNGGRFMTINESYRTLATQQDYFNSGITQAIPGTSNHGTALAADINTGDFSSTTYQWLAANASKYGFVNPNWAKDRSDAR